KSFHAGTDCRTAGKNHQQAGVASAGLV
ncbi:terminase, partial [Escherichia coli]|nr:terminase [Escherichia coli]